MANKILKDNILLLDTKTSNFLKREGRVAISTPFGCYEVQLDENKKPHLINYGLNSIIYEKDKVVSRNNIIVLTEEESQLLVNKNSIVITRHGHYFKVTKDSTMRNGLRLEIMPPKEIIVR